MRRRYRQLLLLLGALALPSLVIGWLGWEVVSRQQQIDRDQMEKRRRQIVAEIGSELLTRLNGIKLRQIAAPPSADGYTDSSIALTAWSDNGHLILPWESAAPDPGLFKRAIEEREFKEEIERATKAAYSRRHEEAVRILRDLAQDADRPALQRAYARIWLAQILRLWDGRQAEANDVYVELLKADSSVVDEDGRLFWQTYAAGPLMDAHAREREVLARVEDDLHAFPALARWSTQLSGTLSRLGSSPDPAVRDAARAARDRLADRMEWLAALQAMPEVVALKAAFPSLRVTPDHWSAFGSGMWLVGMGPPAVSGSLVLAVRAEDVRRAVEADRAARGVDTPFRFTQTPEAGDPLGDSLPGLRAVLLNSPDPLSGATTGRQQVFYAVSLTLVIGLTFFGGFLLWRDTRRESRLAELRSQFVSSVSHELKTPLTSIRMFAETLQIKDSAANPRRRADYLATIVSESERLTRLLNNVLDFSRIEHGQKTYRLQSAALADSVRAAAQAMRFPLAEQQFEFETRISAEIPPMPIDGDAIEQAVLNLLSNAMKYSGERRHIELRLLRQNGHARIEVADRGFGIAPEEQRRIFEKFYRAPTPENRAISGAGLGLALVAHIAEGHGGRVEVQSTPGEGSTFSICLPLNSSNGANHS